MLCPILFVINRSGFRAAELIAARYPLFELKRAGYSIAELYNAGKISFIYDVFVLNCF